MAGLTTFGQSGQAFGPVSDKFRDSGQIPDKNGCPLKGGTQFVRNPVRAYLIDFASPPPVGFTLTAKAYRRQRTFRLVSVEPVIRKRDGAASAILHWVDQYGFAYSSGLRCKSMSRVKTGRD